MTNLAIPAPEMMAANLADVQEFIGDAPHGDDNGLAVLMRDLATETE